MPRIAKSTSGIMAPMDVHEVLLPGVGLRYEFESAEGDLLRIVALRHGGFVVAVSDHEDPDAPRAQYRLTDEEAETLAQILGAPRLAERFADLTREVPGLVAGQVLVEDGSPYAGQPLGATRARSRTGASIVAVVREDTVAASPGPEHVLRSGDTLVVIGTPEGISQVATLVRSG